MTQAFNQSILRSIAITLISFAPFEYVFFQTALMIRESIIKKRIEYNSDDEEYKTLYWTATIISYIAIAEFFSGIILFIASL